MKLGTVLWRVGLIAVVAACAGQYWLVQRTHEAAARWVARLVPHGDLHYERLWPFPWGAGRVWGLSFEPAGGLQMALGTSTGLRIQARELRVDEMRRGEDGTIARLRGRLVDVRVPVAERRAQTSDSPDPSRVPPPTLYDLGYTELRFDLDFDLQYLPSSNLALLRLDALGAQLGRAVLDARLQGSPRVFDRAPDQILVRRLELEFEDGGLLARFKDVSAARSRLNRTAWEAAMVEALDRRARKEGWKWSESTALAARRVVRDSSYFHALIDPPGDVALRNIRLYPIADWPALLGFGLTTEPGGERIAGTDRP